MSVYVDLFLAKVQIQYFIFLSLSATFVTVSCAALEVLFHCCFLSVSSFDYLLSFHCFLQRLLFITPSLLCGVHRSSACTLLPFILEYYAFG